MSYGESGAISVYPTSSGDYVYPVSYYGENNAQNVHRSSYFGENNAKCVRHVSYYGENNAKCVYYVGCFPASELVFIDSDLYVPIGSLKIRDKICSWEAEHGRTKYIAVSKIHKYIVNEIICINNIVKVSSSHPLMVMERNKNGISIPKWKVAFEVKVYCLC
ncbi:Hint domain-containing protein [Treponema sp. R80B11-R83G3]